ncbi:MAG TPA: hypothetical protein VLI05_01645 [Candidatus Saccharimonadia bacterium]|nr:hypothetical protein [Candidatus Saccharimonadia bacterium]
MKTVRAVGRRGLALARRWLALWLPLTMLALLPLLTDFLSNRYQVAVQDLYLPTATILLTTLVVWAIFYRLWRRDALAGYSAALLTTAFFSFNYDGRLTALYPFLQALVPTSALGFLEGPVFSLVFMAAIVLGAYWTGRGVSRAVAGRRWPAREIMAAATIAITATFVFQALPTMHDLVVAWPQFFYKPPQLTSLPASAKSAPKPDIYYIVMDRYANQDVLQSQFSFDNSSFINFLKDNQYYVNPSDHNNYPYTTMSIASTMDADYLGDAISKFGKSTEQTVIPYHESIRNSPVAQALAGIGYQYDFIGNWYETSNLTEVPNATTYQPEGVLTILGRSWTLNNFGKAKLNASIFWRFLPNSPKLDNNFRWLNYSGQSGPDMTHYQLQTLTNLANQQPGGRFIFAHILVPHDPYFFNADGSINTNINDDNTGEPVKQKYLGQVQYINGQMKTLLTKINQNSHGQAVIVLQSDEGPYPFQLNDENFNNAGVDEELADGDMRSWSAADLQMKYGNLAAYHVPAADLAANPTGADPVNIFRLVLNDYFGGQFPYLPECYYAYPDGRNRPLNYANITKTLTGQDNPACQDDGSGPKP